MARKTKKSLLSFNAGIWSAKMDARTELEKYQYGLRQGENVWLLPYGAADRRQGTKYIYGTKSDGFVVLWPFQFSSSVGYIIEVGNLYMRFYKDGAFIPDTGDVDSDSDTTEPFEISSPYATADLRELQFRQINDVVYITHEDYTPYKLTRETETTFSLAAVTFDTPPFRDENITSTTITPSATTGSITLTASTSIFTSGNVGGYYRIGHRRAATSVKKLLNDGTGAENGSSSAIEILGDWNVRTTGRWKGTLTVERQNTVTSAWEVIRRFECNDADRNIDAVGENLTTANLRITLASSGDPTETGAEAAYAYLEAADAYVYGYVLVTAYSSGTSVTATVIDDLEDTAATATWSEGAWSTRRGFPRTCTLYEQRMFYASNTSEPLNVWATVIGDFENFEYGVNDDDAFVYSIPSTEQNPIEWIAGQRNLIIANGKEYGVLGSGSDDLTMTPTNAVYRIQGAVGFSSIKPEIIGDVMIGVERNGRRLREMAYDIQRGASGGYAAADLCRLNDEIAASGIVDMDFTQLREPYLLCVMSDGTMGVLAYNREDGIVGWSKFTTNGLFESVAVIRGTDKDEIWIAVKRTVNGATKRFVERFDPTTWSDKEDAYYVDCGITYDGAEITTLTGLDHLDGEEVQILGDGAVYDAATPSSGSVSLLSSGESVGASVVHAGLGYDSVIEPMRLDADPLLGNTQGHQKMVNEVYVRFYKSLGMTWNNGVSDRNLPFRDTIDEMDESPPLFTGEKKITWDSTFGTVPENNDPKLILKQTQPLPLTVLAVIVKYLVADR